jgi:hypothetical protein
MRDATIDRHAVGAVEIDIAQLDHGVGVAARHALAQPDQGLGHVAAHALAVQVQHGQVDKREASPLRACCRVASNVALACPSPVSAHAKPPVADSARANTTGSTLRRIGSPPSPDRRIDGRGVKPDNRKLVRAQPDSPAKCTATQKSDETEGEHAISRSMSAATPFLPSSRLGSPPAAGARANISWPCWTRPAKAAAPC